MSIQNNTELAEIKKWYTLYQSLPPQQKEKLPALLNGLGKLQHASGDCAGARVLFAQVANVSPDERAKAEAHHNAYLSALERHEWDKAFNSLQAALSLDRNRFAPFNLDLYTPEKILGAGGFGVVFLCRHGLTKGHRVIKSLRADLIGQNLTDQVLHEAKNLEALNHNAIITLYDCAYVDADKTRLFLAMEYFEGVSLAHYVKTRGCLHPHDVLEIARQIASGLEAAHKEGILHRDIKPDNVLVRKDESGWQVKIIDFGLAMATPMQQVSINTAAGHASSTVSDDIAGTVDYAAPEQMGKLEKVQVGAYSDIFGFGRTICYALFGIPHPLGRDWLSLPPTMVRWLDRCLEETPKKRWPNVAGMLKALQKVKVQKPKKKKKPVEKVFGLVVVQGVEMVAEYTLHEGQNVIGRDKADIDLSNQETPNQDLISPQHCIIRVSDGKLILNDNNSAKGTFLNRQRLDPKHAYPLKENDEIQLGRVKLQVAMVVKKSTAKGTKQSNRGTS